MMRTTTEINRLITEELSRFAALQIAHIKTMDALYVEHLQSLVYELNRQSVDNRQETADNHPGDNMQKESDKLEAASQAKKLLASEFVIIDTETTGFKSDDEIIQIAIIDQTGATLLDSLVKPTKPILNSSIHGITDEMVKDAPPFSDLYVKITEALADKRLVSYNFDFDSRMIDQDRMRHGFGHLGYMSSLCVMELYAAFYGEWDSYHHSYRWQKLNSAVAAFGLKFDGKAHSALTDAKATLAVLKKMAEWFDEHTIQIKPKATESHC